MDIDEQALRALRQLTRPDAVFHADQLEIIRHLVIRRGRAIVVQRTGWGKSALYFVATHLRRAQGCGPTLVVSPLLALMRNQIQAASRLNLSAASMDSTNETEWRSTTQRAVEGRLDLLYVSPERFQSDYFSENVWPRLSPTVGLFVIDEAHCISDWGHDFRPEYRRLFRPIAALSHGTPLLCCTATANQRVLHDIREQVGESTIVRGPLARPGLALHVVPAQSRAERLAWLSHLLSQLSGSGIIYCSTVLDTKRSADWLRMNGHRVESYSGDMRHLDRLRIEEDLLAGRLRAVTATSALGMGYDKSDISFVLHYQAPGSVIDYYQQVGRAGRTSAGGHGVLLTGYEDESIQEHFIDNAHPAASLLRRILGYLESSEGPQQTEDIEQHIDERHSILETSLRILAVDDAVCRGRDGWVRTDEAWRPDLERIKSVREARRAELRQMADYKSHPGCRMRFLRRALDDLADESCGLCDRCTGATLTAPAADTVRVAHEFLETAPIPIPPRLVWPRGVSLDRHIPLECQACEGRSLSVVEDDGCFPMVARFLKSGEGLSDVAEALATLVLARWQPTPLPTCLVPVPIVPGPADADRLVSLGREVATLLDVPCILAIELTASRPNGAQNSFSRILQLKDLFEVKGDFTDDSVVLLQDICRSRWTTTLVSALLGMSGARAVHPLGLIWSPW